MTPLLARYRAEPADSRVNPSSFALTTPSASTRESSHNSNAPRGKGGALRLSLTWLISPTPRPSGPSTSANRARLLTNPWPDQMAKLFRAAGMTQSHALWGMPFMRQHVLVDVGRHVRLLKRLARSTDRSLRAYVASSTGTSPWTDDYTPLGRPFAQDDSMTAKTLRPGQRIEIPWGLD